MGHDLRPGFAAALRQEVEAILTDPAFCRAPNQSQLLQLLCQRTVDGEARNLSQYAIAIDGLNKLPNYDPISSSNVRVQIYRLRAALEKHYSLFQPSAGLCVYLKLGSYQLRLGRLETAYPKIGNEECKVVPAPGPTTALPLANPYLQMWRISVIAAIAGMISSVLVWRLLAHFG